MYVCVGLIIIGFILTTGLILLPYTQHGDKLRYSYKARKLLHWSSPSSVIFVLLEAGRNTLQLCTVQLTFIRTVIPLWRYNCGISYFTIVCFIELRVKIKCKLLKIIFSRRLQFHCNVRLLS